MTARTKKAARKKRQHQRAASRDRFTLIAQRAVVIGGTAVGIYGQAELLGEPWRHVIAVGAFLILMGAAFWMKET